VRRTQLYLEDDIWKALHILARQSGCTVSELARRAIREKYAGDANNRKEALLSAIGLWKDRTDLPDTQSYIRSLRKGDRLKRLSEKRLSEKRLSR
jgi:predicted DNA-binding ribbon-helix-helix protein